MPDSCFPSTRAFTNEFERLNGFVWPSAGALWNLRWQVRGLVAEAPDATNSDLQSRFLSGSGINRVDFEDFLHTTWSEQLTKFAEFALVSFIALFESWLGERSAALNIDSVALQFPSRSVGLRRSRTGAPLDGASESLARAGIGSSAGMAACYSHLNSRNHFALAKLDNLLICYRYWKEVRNAIAHTGRLATDRVAEAQALLQPLTRTDLSTRALPEWTPTAVGAPIDISLRGVMGFAEVILKLALTYDAQLATTSGAETEFIRAWRTAWDCNFRSLPAEPGRQLRRIVGIAVAAGYGRPRAVPELTAMLAAHVNLAR